MLTFFKRPVILTIAVTKAIPAIVASLWLVFRLVVMAAFLWSFVAVLIKSIIKEYETLAMTSARTWPYFFLSMTYISHVDWKKSPAHKRSWRRSTRHAFRQVFWHKECSYWVCVISSALGMALMTYALLDSQGGFVTFIAAAAFFPVALASGKFLDHVLSRDEKQVVWISIIGVVIIIADCLRRAEYWGVGLGLLCAVSFAVNQIARNRWGNEKGPGFIGIEPWVCSTTMVAVALSYFIWQAGLPSFWDGMKILALGTLATWFADLLYVRAQAGTAGFMLLHVMVISRLTNVLTPVWIWYWLGEKISVYSIIGAVAFMAGIIRFAIMLESDKKKKERGKRMPLRRTEEKEEKTPPRWLEDLYTDPPPETDIDPLSEIDPDILLDLIEQVNRDREGVEPDNRVARADEDINELVSRSFLAEDPAEYGLRRARCS